MAGLGSRFADAGYKLPKPLIVVSGKPMISNVIRHMPVADKWIFIVRQEHVDEYKIDELIKKEVSGAIVIPIAKTTEGQASTCMLAMPHINPCDSIFIAACDNTFLYNEELYNQLVKDNSIDSIVWTFTNADMLVENPTSWGWVKLASDARTINGMSVKVPVSFEPRNDHAVVASFFFRKAADFIASYDLMVKENYRINGEFYVDCLPIYLNKLNKKSVIFDVDLYVGWGKPSDLHYYEEKERLYKAGSLSTISEDVLWKRFFDRNTSVLRGQILRYIVTGFTTVAIDFILYYLLSLTIDHSLAKGVSFLCGTIFAYIVNKYWTFKKTQKSCKEMFSFLLLYSITLVINVAVNFVMLSVLGNVLFSFLVATGVSTVLNFLGQKLIIFK
jgi:putative flippase GtrA/dTDP-glucose pyrophosphorylase